MVGHNAWPYREVPVKVVGSAAHITEFDAGMFRDWWRHLKSRYGL